MEDVSHVRSMKDLKRMEKRVLQINVQPFRNLMKMGHVVNAQSIKGRI